MAWFGHSGSQAPQLMHSSVMIVATRVSVTAGFGIRARRVPGDRSTDPDRLRIRELANSLFGQLAPIAGGLDAPEGKPRVALHHAVDEYLPGVELVHQASGPTPAASSCRSPILSARIPWTKRFSNSGAIFSCTMKRLAAMQLWPAFWTRAATATWTALSRSALGSTTKGSLPPSSRTVFFSCAPAVVARLRPAPSLPVRVAATIRGSSTSFFTFSLPTRSVWKHPSG